MSLNVILKDLINRIKLIKESRAIKSKKDTTLSLYTENGFIPWKSKKANENLNRQQIIKILAVR